MKKTLTALALAALKPKATAYYVSDIKQDGLRVRVAPSGLLTWGIVVRIKGGGLKSISLGRCDPDGRDGMDLATARDRASAIVKAAREGRDLLSEEQEERKAKAGALSVSGLIDRYHRYISSPNRKGGPLRTADDIKRRLDRALALKLTTPAEAIRRSDISDLLDEVAQKYPREAEKRRQSMGALFRWAVAKGYVAVSPIDGTPSYGRGETKDRVLSTDEIQTLWRWLDNGADGMPPDAIAVLRLQLLTGARVGEISGMDAAELSIDGERLLWTLPAARAKNKRDHIRPLTGRARVIVETALKGHPEGALFRTLDGDRALRSDDIGLALNHRTRPIAHFTTHDLRRTVVSGMDELGIPLDTIAAVVGHQRGTRATQTLIRHYARPKLDNRIEAALTEWGEHVMVICSGPQGWQVSRI